MRAEPEASHRASTGKGFTCRQQQMLGGTPAVAGAIEIERWRGLAALDRPGLDQDNRDRRAKEESDPGCGSISMSSLSEAGSKTTGES
jgi:hypothetical protein